MKENTTSTRPDERFRGRQTRYTTGGELDHASAWVLFAPDATTPATLGPSGPVIVLTSQPIVRAYFEESCCHRLGWTYADIGSAELDEIAQDPAYTLFGDLKLLKQEMAKVLMQHFRGIKRIIRQQLAGEVQEGISP